MLQEFFSLTKTGIIIRIIQLLLDYFSEMNWQRAVIRYTKCIVFSLALTLVSGLVSNGTRYGDGPSGASETDLYGFPHTWRTYTYGSKIWSYDFGNLIFNVLELSVLSFLVLLFIDRVTGNNNFMSL